MAKDILIKEIFKNGDFNIGFSDEQHVEHVLMSNQGDFKNAPLVGVGIRDYINSPFTPKVVSELERKIRLNLEADGAKNISVSIDPETKTINSNGTY